MKNVTATEVKNLFSETSKEAYEAWAKENDGVTLQEYCNSIAKNCNENEGTLEDAEFIIEDSFKQLGLNWG